MWKIVKFYGQITWPLLELQNKSHIATKLKTKVAIAAKCLYGISIIIYKM